MSEKISVGLYKHEIECPCCHKAFITPVVSIGYTFLRMWYGKPITISSVFRCPGHNEAINGSPNSQHLKGNAMDLIVPEGYTVDTWANVCEHFFPRVFTGYVHPVTRKYVKYNNHVHVDAKNLNLDIHTVSNWLTKITLAYSILRGDEVK